MADYKTSYPSQALIDDLRKSIHRNPELWIPLWEHHQKIWYRISDREKVKTPIDKSRIGTDVYVDRAIDHVGYFLEYHDVHGLLWREFAERHAREILRPFTKNEAEIDLIYRVATHAYGGENLLTNVLWDIRTLALSIFYDTRPDLRNVRTGFYRTLDGYTKVHIDGVKYHWYGRRYPGSRGNGYEGDYGEPPSLDGWQLHGFYVCHSIEGYNIPMLIHPLDILDL